ncbi:MAG: Ig-like domain-containing protein [Eubacterium sp.]|nr:Ig-like domain-containing protein [Eubacterium sp.]
MKHRIFSVVLCLVMICSFLLPSAGCIGAKKAVKLKQTSVSLKVGEKKKIKVKNAPKSAIITFASDNKKVASVTKYGVIRAKNIGFAGITVRIKKKNKTIKKLYCMVEVVRAPYEPKLSDEFTGDKDAPIDEAFADQVRDFSVDMFRIAAADDVSSGKNTMISPFSVLTDMMMAAGGADGTTLDEMKKVMCGSVGFDSFRKSLSDLNARFFYSDPVIFHMANSVWVRDEDDRIKVKQSFLSDSLKWYNAEAYQVPFDAAFAEKVNAWVNKNTLGMIPKLMEGAPADSDVMHLINAIAFEGAWAEPYTDFQIYEKGEFTSAKGEKEKATMLCDTQSTYFHDENATGFARPYEGYSYSFVAILPNENISAADYLKNLDGKTFANFIGSSQGGYDVHTRIPEFAYDYSNELNAPLKEMGIKNAFDEDADFSSMAETKSGALYIDKVIHKTHIELDRNGTKAAAVTDVSMSDTTSLEPDPKKSIDIFLDRPFIYAIIERDTGIPVFMGVLNTLKQ